MMADGYNAGVFQLEGGTMADGIRKIKPHRFEDVVACTSIYRKGPMLAGAHERYIANKKAKEVRVLHPKLYDILEPTWGEMAYQEQLMQIASEIAGFDQGLVADLLAAVRFKDPKMMAPLKEKFIKGCRTHSHIKGSIAEKIWAQFETQASYLFNRCHAVSYSLLSYQTARLKCWWPLQYLTALMRTVPAKDPANKEKRQTYLAEATDMGIKILPPDINLSGAKMTCGEHPTKGMWMRFGFTDIKGIGESTAAKILSARAEAGKFTTMREINAYLSPGVVEKLGGSGCLHKIKGGAQRDLGALEGILFWQFNDVMAPLRTKYKEKVRLPGTGNSRVLLMGEIIDKKNKETKTGKPYMTWRIRWTPSDIFTITIWEDAESLWSTEKGSIVAVEGTWNSEFRNVSVGDADRVRVLRHAKKEEAA
jgi:DNA polymerase III alpha subunit